MEELERFRRCLDRLRDATNRNDSNGANNEPTLRYEEFFQKVQKLRQNATLQTINMNARLAAMKCARDRMKEEIPEALSLVAPHLLGEFRQLCFGPSGPPRTPLRVNTPLSARKRLTKDATSLARKLMSMGTGGGDTTITPTAPKVKVPTSTKRLQQAKQPLRCTPMSLGKGRTFDIKPRFHQTMLAATPEMPTFRRKSKSRASRSNGSLRKTLRISPVVPRTRTGSSQKDSKRSGLLLSNSLQTDDSDSTPEKPALKSTESRRRTPPVASASGESQPAPPAAPRSPDLQASNSNNTDNASSISKSGKKTPQMKERVVFFNNPNVENIHQRYVAIQDSRAEESTCLLLRSKQERCRERRCGASSSTLEVRESTTPERPRTSMRNAKKVSTPPPPLVFEPTPRKSLTPDLPHLRTTSALPQSTGGKSLTPHLKPCVSRTPSPPRPAGAVRRCLAAKLNQLPGDRITEKTLLAEAATSARLSPPVALPAVNHYRTPELPVLRCVTFEQPSKQPQLNNITRSSSSIVLSTTMTTRTTAIASTNSATAFNASSVLTSGRRPAATSTFEKPMASSHASADKVTAQFKYHGETRVPLQKTLPDEPSARQRQTVRPLGSIAKENDAGKNNASSKENETLLGKPVAAAAAMTGLSSGVVSKSLTKTSTKTPKKHGGSQSRTQFQTPLNTVLATKEKTDEKQRSIRPSKMQRSAGKR